MTIKASVLVSDSQQ